MTHANRRAGATLVAAAFAVCFASSATAQQQPGPEHRCIDWKRLNLSTQQYQAIGQLDDSWHAKYQHTQPQIIENQRKLERLLSDSKSDPLEIMATQQNIARLKEQLRNEATTNYLRKRAVLNEGQQHQLEGMLSQMVMDRQRTSPMVQADQAGGIGNIVNKIKWAIEPH
jgi:hypothetical protein